MPKAPCPACRTEVKYRRDAGPGTELTCPACDEVFVPPELRLKGAERYDPEADPDVYRAERAPDDPEREARGRRAMAAAHRAAAAERARERAGPRRKAWHQGPEVWLLIFAAGAGGGLPFGLWLARNWERMGATKFFWLVLALLAVMAAAVGLGMSSWAWLRRNR
jgi:hypothetical protein